MHQAGTRMVNKLIRNGRVIRQNSVEVWEFNQNGGVIVQQEPYEMLPGDGYRTTCYHRGDYSTVWGLESHQEMCMVFVYYYNEFSDDSMPKCGYTGGLGFGACAASFSSSMLLNEEDMYRNFGMCGASLKDDGPCPDAHLCSPDDVSPRYYDMHKFCLFNIFSPNFCQTSCVHERYVPFMTFLGWSCGDECD